MTGAVLAQRFSRCPGCNACIRPDDPIVEAKDGRWYHEECVPAPQGDGDEAGGES